MIWLHFYDISNSLSSILFILSSRISFKTDFYETLFSSSSTWAFLTCYFRDFCHPEWLSAIHLDWRKHHLIIYKMDDKYSLKYFPSVAVYFRQYFLHLMEIILAFSGWESFTCQSNRNKTNNMNLLLELQPF